MKHNFTAERKQRTPGRVLEEPTCSSSVFQTGASTCTPYRTAAGPTAGVCPEFAWSWVTETSLQTGAPGDPEAPGGGGGEPSKPAWPPPGQAPAASWRTASPPSPYLVGVLAVLQVHDALAPALRVAQHVVLRVLQEGRGAGGGERGGGKPAGLQVQRAVRPQPAALRVRRLRLGTALRLLALLGGDGEPGDDGRQHPVGGPAAPFRRVGQLPGGCGGDGGAASLEEGAELPHAQPLGPAEVRAAVQPGAGLHGGVGAGRLPGSAPGPAAGGVHGGTPRRRRRRRGKFFVAQSPAAARSPAARFMSSPPSLGSSDSPAATAGGGYRAR